MRYRPRGNSRGSYSGKRRHPLRRMLLLLLGLGLLCFAGLEAYIGVHSRDKLVGQSQVMVVFGCRVMPWGPSILLQDRLDTALAYLEGHPDMTVVVTGGKGDDEHMSEAQCMYNYLTDHGVDGERIYMEDRSRNTWQNVNYTIELLAEKGHDTTENLLLVSSGFHLSRIELLFDRAQGGTTDNLSTLAAPVSHIPSAVQMFFREPMALVKSFIFDR